MRSEVQVAFRTMRRRKAVGEDETPVEMNEVME